MAAYLACTPKSLPKKLWGAAADTAVELNPANRPHVERLVRVIPNFVLKPSHIVALTSKRWPSTGVKLTVGFMDSPKADLQKRILSHMNAWAKNANVKFTISKKSPTVRIAREPDGYWSYLGTDVTHIPANEQTMNLEEFTMATPESEFVRVVRHETGHTLGFPHEHMRKDLVAKIDRQKAIEHFMATQGWSEQEVIQQVLTPLDPTSLIVGTINGDPKSIMCYQIPGELTKNGKPILGGVDIDKSDYAFAGKLYPKQK